MHFTFFSISFLTLIVSSGTVLAAEYENVVRSYVRLYIEDGSDVYFCGGTLYEYNKVATSASCLQHATNITICAGSLDCHPGGDGDTCLYFNAEEFAYIHEDYVEALEFGQIYGDAAYISLPEVITDLDIKTLPLSRRKTCCDGVERYHQLVGYLVGCDAINIRDNSSQDLLKMFQWTIDVEDGLKYFNKTFRPYQDKYKLIFTQAGEYPYRPRLCLGDTGGPLAFYNPNNHGVELAATVSFVGPLCQTGYPAASTVVEEYYGFYVTGKDGVKLMDAKATIATLDQGAVLAARGLVQPKRISDASTLAALLALKESLPYYAA